MSQTELSLREGLKPLQDIDSESSAMLDEVKSKKRNRLLVNKKYKDNTN